MVHLFLRTRRKLVLWPRICWRWFMYTSCIRSPWSIWESEFFHSAKKHFLWDLNSCGIVFWSREKILGLGSVLWWECALCWDWESSRISLQYNFITMLRVCARGRGIVEGLTIALTQDAEGMLNIPALLGAGQLLRFLGRMRALQLVDDGLSGLSLT